MPKYTVHFKTSGSFTIDTDDYEDDFAKTKNELADKPDPNDPDAVHDFFMDHEDLLELMQDNMEDNPDSLEIKAVK